MSTPHHKPEPPDASTNGASHGRNGSANGQYPVLITGGAGFVGANLAHRLLEGGTPVLVYDNLSRAGVERNLRWLVEAHGTEHLTWQIEDVRDPAPLREAVAHAGAVYHFAGQTAVTTSLEAPAEDFAVNLQGTLHLLEALRRRSVPPPLVFTSTNKVYGALGDVVLEEEERRYVPADAQLRASGISEHRPLDFHSPYGCSKGAAGQYVLDYARSFGLPATVFRMSCIYGPHQLGTEDQGWVAHFVNTILRGAGLTLYGDGKQVRDVLFINDLVEALMLARRHMEALRGEAFNIGGGPERTMSLLELIERVVTLRDDGASPRKEPPLRFADWRRGDQKYYASDTSKFEKATGWRPEIGVEEGVARLYAWQRRRQAGVKRET